MEETGIDPKLIPSEHRRKQVTPNRQQEKREDRSNRRNVKLLWMTYYNDTLFEQHIIDEEHYRKMKVLIRAKYAGSTTGTD